MERLKSLIPSGESAPQSASERRSPSAPSTEPGSVHERHSHGLEQFSAPLREQQGLYILDLGGVTQANVVFVTNLGHKLYSEDFLRALDGESAEESSPALIEAFLGQNLNFPEAHFDGVLLWDTLQFLPQPLLKATVDRLCKITKPGSYMLALFHADEKAASVPVYSYRISNASTLTLAHQQMRRPVQLFNNRAVERLFQRFQSVKFFLTRDNLREVIVRR
jgi:hypothetical protein